MPRQASQHVTVTKQVRVPHEQDDEAAGIVGDGVGDGLCDERISLDERPARDGLDAVYCGTASAGGLQDVSVEPSIEPVLLEPRFRPAALDASPQVGEMASVVQECVHARLVLPAEELHEQDRPRARTQRCT